MSKLFAVRSSYFVTKYINSTAYKECKQTLWPAVCKQTIPAKWSPFVGEVNAIFAGKGV
jgi:hypothetical protein